MRIIQGVGWGFSTTASGTIATDLIPPTRRGEGMGYFGLSGNLALAFGPSLGLTLVGKISFTSLFLICGAMGLAALLLSTQIRYKKVEESPNKAAVPKFDIFEKSAIKPSLLLFFITVTFGGIASFLPLYAAEKDIAGIELYFLVYAIFLMLSRTFAGKIYDKKGHLYVSLCFPPWNNSSLYRNDSFVLASEYYDYVNRGGTIMLIAAGLYGLGFGSVQPALQAWAVECICISK